MAEKSGGRSCLWIMVVMILVIIAGVIYAVKFTKQQIETFEETKQDIAQTYGQGRVEAAGQVMPYFLGAEEPKTFLVLLQNNTEMRPSGGFVGTYGIVEINNGEVTDWFVQGTEVLDNNAVEGAEIPEAPAPIREYMVQPQWFFRDMNWDPDFPTSAERMIEAYREESGEDIHFDGVIAVTPTVLERLMKHIGTITVDGVTLSSDNFTERLEYEVEYGYEQRGDHFNDRKSLIGDLLQEIIHQFESRIFSLWPKAIDVVFASLADKQILLYATDEQTQTTIVKQGWAGHVSELETGEDSFMVVDANLASLKTDHAMERSYYYQIVPEDGRYKARLEVQYKHTGSFDWRTTRYRSWTRIYLPEGVQFITGDGAMVKDRSTEKGEFVVSQEDQRTVVGAFFAVEPGKEHTLWIEYWLPKEVAQTIDDGVYTLFAQKQAGLIAPALTLGLDFGTTVHTAEPSEPQQSWGDNRYTYSGNLHQDQEFIIGLK